MQTQTKASRTHLSTIHDKDFITVPDGIDTVCDGEHSVVTATLSDGLLNQEVGARVHRGCRFIQHQDLQKQMAQYVFQLAQCVHQSTLFWSLHNYA